MTRPYSFGSPWSIVDYGAESKQKAGLTLATKKLRASRTLRRMHSGAERRFIIATPLIYPKNQGIAKERKESGSPAVVGRNPCRPVTLRLQLSVDLPLADFLGYE